MLKILKKFGYFKISSDICRGEGVLKNYKVSIVTVFKIYNILIKII